MPKSDRVRVIDVDRVRAIAVDQLEPDANGEAHCGPAHSGNSVDADNIDDVSDGEVPPGPVSDSSMDVGLCADADLRELFAVLRRDEKAAIREADDDILSIVKSLGGDQNKYRRE